MKLFISYARVDKPLCKQIVEQLSNIHDVWYDRRLHAGQDWWDEIQERLEWCEGFVYLLSPESVASEYCQKEYAIAVDSGKHIFPVLIQARTEIPKSMSHIHYADLSEGMEDIITLMNALTIAERRGRKAQRPIVKAPPPVKPAEPPKGVSPTLALAEAADALEEENFDHAVFTIKQALEQKPSGRIQRMLQNMLQEAETALERQAYLREAEREYKPIRELVARSATKAIGCAGFAEFQYDFPDYDPDNLAGACASDVSVSVRKQHAASLPPPFEWIEIPEGQVILGKGYAKSAYGEGKTFDVPTFEIAKYPITNAQFAKFIKAGGYNQSKWWTEAGWKQKQSDSWTEPRFWRDNKWNGATQPIVGVSWYEAVAFCQWLSEVTGENILLPTEQQWQRVAQGDDDRAYPWGINWNASRCNNKIDNNGIGKTTPVTEYEGKSDSPYGVVDMSGNVWEWCLTEYETGKDDLNGTNVRVLRGGSWVGTSMDDFRCDFRNWSDPDEGYDSWDFGFPASNSFLFGGTG